MIGSLEGVQQDQRQLQAGVENAYGRLTNQQANQRCDVCDLWLRRNYKDGELQAEGIRMVRQGKSGILPQGGLLPLQVSIEPWRFIILLSYYFIILLCYCLIILLFYCLIMLYKTLYFLKYQLLGYILGYRDAPAVSGLAQARHL